MFFCLSKEVGDGFTIGRDTWVGTWWRSADLPKSKWVSFHGTRWEKERILDGCNAREKSQKQDEFWKISIVWQNVKKWQQLSVTDECILLKFISWSPNPQCSGIRRYSLWEVIRFKWVHDSGLLLMQLVPYEEETKELAFSLHPHPVKTIIKWLPVSQEECSHQTLNLPAPWSWISSLQKCEK